MKKLINILIRSYQQVQSLVLKFSILIIGFIPAASFAQADSTSTVAPEKTTYSPLVEFTPTQKTDNSVDLKVSVKAKINGTLMKLAGMKVEFYAVSDSASNLIAQATTDGKGVAFINVKSEQVVTNQEGKLNFKAVVAAKDSIEAAEESVSVKRARLEITPIKEDSLLTVKLRLVDLSSGSETPVAETDLGVYVKRLFSNLKLGEGKTDESGEVTIELPTDLAGDDKGNIILLGRADDNETYGNLEAAVVQKWGTPVSYEVKELPRALWSAHPPLWMLITFIILMTAVWGHYIVIIFELFRLRKEEPKPIVNN